MDTMSRGSGHAESEPAHPINGVYDSGGILSPELQSNISILLVINESCYLLGIDVPRGEALPSRKDGL